MMKGITAFISGLLLAGVAAAMYESSRGRSNERESDRFAGSRAGQAFERDENLFDLNAITVEELLVIEPLDAEMANRIIEGRPYRNKLDLLSRMIVPEDVYQSISHRVMVSEPEQPVKIA
jgi:hypothetical protein